MQEIEIIQQKKKHDARLQEIVAQGYFVVELHMHTTNSDGLASPKKALKIAKKKGLVLAITDHNSILDFSRLTKEEKERIIPAIEITSKESIDILAYFYDEKELQEFYTTHVKKRVVNPFKTNIPINELLEILKKYNCVLTAPHPDYPFDPVRLNFRKAINKNYITTRNLARINLIEVFNAGHGYRMIDAHKKLAKKLKKPFIVGSDAHTAGSIGNAIAYCKAKNKKEFLDKLKKGEVNMLGRKTPKIINVLPITNQGFIYITHGLGLR